MSLKLYSTLIKRDKDRKIEDIAIIEENFSFFATIFSILWFLSHKMWQSSVIFLVFQYILVKSLGIGLLSGVDVFFLEVALLFGVGMNARYWYGQYLVGKGYEKANYVLAQNEEEARLKAMKSLHFNSPDLSFDEFSEEIIDPDLYLKNVIKK